jgi:protein-L-isoaspartate(D-aspartate) O-methyltransferase
MPILKKSKSGNSKSEEVRNRAPVLPVPREYAIARRRMVEDQLRSRGISDPRVLSAMEAIPRHGFVEEALVPQAYSDSRLNIGFGQTISQPYTVALLAQALHLKGSETVLEIGTGCGYQTAVLAALARQVYSIERLHPLLMKGRTNLRRLGVKNVVLKYGDGSKGWPEKAPFDAIVAAAVSPGVPEPLIRQLKPGGCLVLPVERRGVQFLIRVVHEGETYCEENLGECRFVRMVGDYAYGDNPRVS